MEEILTIRGSINNEENILIINQIFIFSAKDIVHFIKHIKSMKVEKLFML